MTTTTTTNYYYLMYPILFQIGPFSLHSLWLCVTIAFVAGILVFAKTAKRQRLNLSVLFNHGTSIMLFTLIVSRFVFYITNLQFFMPTFSMNGLLRFFYIWDKGLSFWGALLGLLIIMAIFLTKKQEDLMKWLDAIIIPIGIGIIIANFGQFLDGQAYGSPTNMPWGITYESINVKYTVPIHPTQLYSMGLVGGILYFLKKHRKYAFFEQDGNTALAAITVYSFTRFWLEFLRGDDAIELLGIRLTSIIALIIFLITGPILRNKFKKFKQSEQL